MRKYFCDACEQEIERPAVKYRIAYGKLQLDITRSVDGIWNDGEVCINCIKDAVANGDLVGEEF